MTSINNYRIEHRHTHTDVHYFIHHIEHISMQIESRFRMRWDTTKQPSLYIRWNWTNLLVTISCSSQENRSHQNMGYSCLLVCFIRVLDRKNLLWKKRIFKSDWFYGFRHSFYWPDSYEWSEHSPPVVLFLPPNFSLFAYWTQFQCVK